MRQLLFCLLVLLATGCSDKLAPIEFEGKYTVSVTTDDPQDWKRARIQTWEVDYLSISPDGTIRWRTIRCGQRFCSTVDQGERWTVSPLIAAEAAEEKSE